MASQLSFGFENKTAKGASESQLLLAQLFLSMHSVNMILERTSESKLFSAKLTLEIVLLLMRLLDVTYQFSWLFEKLITSLAFESLLDRVARIHVVLQGFAGLQSFATIGTIVDAVNLSFVLNQSLFVLEHFSDADVALVVAGGTPLAVVAFVHVHVGFLAKHTLASVALECFLGFVRSSHMTCQMLSLFESFAARVALIQKTCKQ